MSCRLSQVLLEGHVRTWLVGLGRSPVRDWRRPAMKLPNDTVPHVTDMIPFFSRQVEDSQCSSELNVTVVICAYTEARWHHTEAAVRSVLSQQRRPQQVLLVIDHNAALAARARQEFPALTVLDSNGEPGLSGARNTGLRAATCGVTAFLD